MLHSGAEQKKTENTSNGKISVLVCFVLKSAMLFESSLSNKSASMCPAKMRNFLFPNASTKTPHSFPAGSQKPTCAWTPSSFSNAIIVTNCGLTVTKALRPPAVSAAIAAPAMARETVLVLADASSLGAADAFEAAVARRFAEDPEVGAETKEAPPRSAAAPAAAVAAPVLREVDAISDLKRMSEGNWSKGMDVLYTQTTLKSTEIR